MCFCNSVFLEDDKKIVVVIIVNWLKKGMKKLWILVQSISHSKMKKERKKELKEERKGERVIESKKRKKESARVRMSQ